MTLIDDRFARDVDNVVKRLQAELQIGTRDAVNAVALQKTLEARHAVQRVLGAEQRMSGVQYRRNRKGGFSRTTTETRAKGGTRINPYFRQATSDMHPTALVGVRGPAQYIEHRRRGGYEVRPAGGRVGVSAAARADPAQRRAELFGGRPQHAAALKIAGEERALAHPGPITRPRAPITRAFATNDVTLERAARTALKNRLG